MPIETRYVVIRNKIEVETFMDKKAADEYDKMLDMADNISAMLDDAPIQLSDNDKEQLSIYLSKQRDDLLIALQAKKVKAVKNEKESKKSDVNPIQLTQVG
jgi:dsDNA-binding SOS-regulon protein